MCERDGVIVVVVLLLLYVQWYNNATACPKHPHPKHTPSTLKHTQIQKHLLHTTGQQLSEPLVAWHLSQHLPVGDALFLGNSMPIRDMDMFAQRLQVNEAFNEALTAVDHAHDGQNPQAVNTAVNDAVNTTVNALENNKHVHDVDAPGALLRSVANVAQGPPAGPAQAVVPCGMGAPVWCNRGASGIDGVLSSAAGFAAGLGRATTLVIGMLFVVMVVGWAFVWGLLLLFCYLTCMYTCFRLYNHTCFCMF